MTFGVFSASESAKDSSEFTMLNSNHKLGSFDDLVAAALTDLQHRQVHQSADTDQTRKSEDCRTKAHVIRLKLPPSYSEMSISDENGKNGQVGLAHRYSTSGFGNNLLTPIKYNNQETLFKCPFSECNLGRRKWFPGFSNGSEYKRHLQFHRCRWMLRHSDNSYSSCSYIPKDNQDLIRHFQNHIDHDLIAQNRHTGNNRTMYYCNWQTCTSKSYSSAGTNNRSHILIHMKKHFGLSSHNTSSQNNPYTE